MNPEGTRITGMISVCSGFNGRAWLHYEIDLETNTVEYMTSCSRDDWRGWPDGHIRRWRRYADARNFYERCRDLVENGVSHG
jgi:hypothetical protein